MSPVQYHENYNRAEDRKHSAGSSRRHNRLTAVEFIPVGTYAAGQAAQKIDRKVSNLSGNSLQIISHKQKQQHIAE